MRRCLIFSMMLMTGCSWLRPDPELVYVEREVPPLFLTPCDEPVKGARTEGGFAELALGWRKTARCNAGRINRTRQILSSETNQ